MGNYGVGSGRNDMRLEPFQKSDRALYEALGFRPQKTTMELILP